MTDESLKKAIINLSSICGSVSEEVQQGIGYALTIIGAYEDLEQKNLYIDDENNLRCSICNNILNIPMSDITDINYCYYCGNNVLK